MIDPHTLPFAWILMSRPPELHNRPALTRLIEQSFVGILSGIVAAYMTIQVSIAKLESSVMYLSQQDTSIVTEIHRVDSAAEKEFEKVDGRLTEAEKQIYKLQGGTKGP